MQSHRPGCIVLVLFLMTGCAGCASLTESQVAAVGRFATVAKSYSELPGAVIDRHAAIRRERQILRISTYVDGDQALAAIESALRQEESLTEKGRQADQALQVLYDYAELLTRLTAKSYTGDLDAAARTLGEKVDQGIAQYNKTWNKSVGGRGATVAEVVRRAGGMYLGARQARALKEVVPVADPLVASLTGTVQETMALYLDPDQLQQLGNAPATPGVSLVAAGLLSEERRDVALFYRGTAGLYRGKQPPELPEKVAEVMHSSDLAARLAAKALQAAAAYRQAHAELAEAVQGKRDLPPVMQRVQVLVDVVQEARALKEKVEQAIVK